MSRQITYNRTMYVQNCCACGIEFGVPDEYDTERRRDHKSFYCPNGHCQSYQGKTEEQKLREKLETEQRNVEFWRKQQQTQEQRAAKAERQRDAYKGHATRLKKRVAKGKCPCCPNTFVNLAAHMKKQHPDYVQEDAGAEVQAQAH